MIVRGILVTIIFIMIPLILGGFWAKYCNVYSEWTVSGVVFRYMIGHISMWAAFQLIGVPMILLKTSFLLTVIVWGAIIALFLIVGIRKYGFFGQSKRLSTNFLIKKKQMIGPITRDLVFEIICVVAVIALVGIQCYFYVFKMHLDEDDSRFVVNALEAYYNNSMLLINPATGEYIGTWVGELSKDVTSPWMIYLAVISKFVLIHPTIVIHTVYPPFLLLIAYSAYWLLADHVFKGDFCSNCIFVAVVAFLNMYFNDSTHTQSFVALVRIWQGKAVVAGVMVPVLLFLLVHLDWNWENKRYIGLLFIAAMGMCLLSGVGIVLSGIMIGGYGMWFACVRRKWTMIPRILLAFIPTLVYGGIYQLIR